MNPEVPNVSLTGRYDIGRTAEALGIHRNTLREISESLLPKHHHRNGRAFYFGNDILKYWRRDVRD